MTGGPLDLRFDRETHPNAAERCAAWRDAFSLSVDTTFAASEVEGFEASAQFRRLGPVLVTDTRYAAHTVLRDQRTITRTGTEQVIVDVFVGGGFVGRVDHRQCHVASGDCFFMDMRGTFRLRLREGRFVGLVMPRSLFEEQIGQDVSLHGVVLPAAGAPAKILGASLVAAADLMRDLSPTLAEALGPALVATAGACLRDAVAAFAPAAAQRGTDQMRRSVQPTLARVSRHIHRHAADPLYDANALAHAFGLSRSALYRLYGTDGGIAAAIRRRRAEIALHLLKEGRAGSLASIAEASGLGNERALRRAFWAAYAATPSTLRRPGKTNDGVGPKLEIGALFDDLAP